MSAPAHAAEEATFVQKFGAHGSANGQFSNPWGVTTDAEGNIYVADLSNRRIQKFSAAGVHLLSVPLAGQSYGVAVDAQGTIYSATSGGTIETFSPDGTRVNSLQAPGVSFVTGIDIDGDGNLYLVNSSPMRVVKLHPNGSLAADWLIATNFDSYGIAVDDAGFVYVSSRQENNIRKFTSAGVLSETWTTVGGRRLNGPLGLDVNAAGQVAVAEYLRYGAAVLDSAGTLVAEWGSNGSGDGQFVSPYGIAIEDDGRVHVSDYSSYRVQTFSLGPVFAAFTPQLSGSGRVGDELTVSASTTPEPAAWTYAWTVAGSDTVRSDEATFTPEAADKGKTASVKVTAKGTDGSPRDRVATVTKTITGKLMDSTAFSITDSTPSSAPTTGDVLTLAVDESKLPDDAAGSVLWGYTADEACVVPQGATASTTYPVVDADAGTTICAQVAYRADEYEDLNLDLVAGSGAVGTFTAPTPTVDDESPVVNQTITASVDLEGAPAGAEVTGSQWGVVEEEECTPIAGADEDSFTAEPSDFGNVLCVTVTVSAPHHVDASKTLTVGAVGAGAFAQSPSVSIGGWVQVGTESSASVSGGDPAGADRAYQWNLDGDPITDATRATYTPKPGDEGHVLTVTVTSSSRGYVDDVTTSNEVEIARGGLDVASPVFSTDRPAVGTPVSLPFDLADAPEGAAAHWQWGTLNDEDCVALNGATTDTFTPTADQVGEVLCAEAGVTAPGYAPIADTFIAENPVVRGTLPAIRAVLNTSSPKVGTKLTTSLFSAELPAGAATTATWGYAAAGKECRPTKVAGSFTTTRDLAGRTICALVTVSAPGYTEFSTVLKTAPVKETAKVAASRKVVKGTDKFVVKAQGLAPGQRYRISIRHRMFSGKADSHGRIARTVRYQKGLKSAKRTIIVRGYTGKKVTYLKKFTVTYRAR